MGTVHVARDVELLRRVALKELSLEVAHDRSARSRFVREVQVTAQLDHPHIVPVYGLEVASGGRPAYAMKLVEGQTFGQLIADTRAFYEKKEPPDEDHALPARLEHFLKVCDAIAYAHERGVVHRDLKPANLMVGRHNEVYVMDWGICRLMAQPAEPAPAPAAGRRRAPARASPARTGSISRAEVSLEASHGETAYGAIVGTPLYMSPEQAHGRHDQLDAKSDQCALGLILFELVALKRPLGGKTLAEVLTQASSGTREPLVHAYGEAIPGELGRHRHEGLRAPRRPIAMPRSPRSPTICAASCAATPCWRGPIRPGSARSARSAGIARRRRSRCSAWSSPSSPAAPRCSIARSARSRRSSAASAPSSASSCDVSEQGDRLQVSLLELHDALDMAVAAVGHAFEYGRPTTGADPVGRRLARRDHRLRHRARHPPRRGRGRSATRRHRPGLGDPRPRLGPRPPRTRQRRRARPRTGRWRRHGPARAARRIRERAQVHGAGGGARADGRRTCASPAWYKAVGDGREFHWALVNHDADGDQELALSAPIVGDSGRRLGAAGLVVALDHALANLVAARPVPNAKLTLLLDADGKLLASHTAAGGIGGGGGMLKLLAAADLATVVKNEVGFVETDRLGAPHIMAFDTIQPLKWTLVTIAETSAVVGDALNGAPWTVAPRSPRSPHSPRTPCCLDCSRHGRRRRRRVGARRGSRGPSRPPAAPSSPRSSTPSCRTPTRRAPAPPASTSSSTSPSPNACRPRNARRSAPAWTR